MPRGILRPLPGLAAVLAVAALAACGGKDDDPAGGEGDLTVVATTTQAADLARSVAGSRARVTALLAPNTDPHSYEVRPDDVKALAEADLVVASGGEVDEWLAEAVEASQTEAEMIVLLDSVPAGAARGSDSESGRASGSADEPDPHWWQDPRNAVRAVEALRAAMTEADREHGDNYARQAERYTARLLELDREVAACVRKLAPRQRRLVTTHDSLGFYARRYGFEVVGAVFPSRSSQGQASAGEIRRLVQLIRRRKVRAVFTETSVRPDVEEAVARESGARLGAPLFADTLGEEGSPGETYIGSMQSNTRALVGGLSGSVACGFTGSP